MTRFRRDALRAAIGVPDGQHQHWPRLEHYLQHYTDAEGEQASTI